MEGEHTEDAITELQRLCIRLKERGLIKNSKLELTNEHQTSRGGCWYRQ